MIPHSWSSGKLKNYIFQLQISSKWLSIVWLFLEDMNQHLPQMGHCWQIKDLINQWVYWSYSHDHRPGVTCRNMGDSKADSSQSPLSTGDSSQKLCPWSSCTTHRYWRSKSPLPSNHDYLYSLEEAPCEYLTLLLPGCLGLWAPFPAKESVWIQWKPPAICCLKSKYFEEKIHNVMFFTFNLMFQFLIFNFGVFDAVGWEPQIWWIFQPSSYTSTPSFALLFFLCFFPWPFSFFYQISHGFTFF